MAIAAAAVEALASTPIAVLLTPNAWRTSGATAPMVAAFPDASASVPARSTRVRSWSRTVTLAE